VLILVNEEFARVLVTIKNCSVFAGLGIGLLETAMRLDERRKGNAASIGHLRYSWDDRFWFFFWMLDTRYWMWGTPLESQYPKTNI
jgi:hypothetical protein